jgi:redox-sensitive bicupin YhaK (pirin superfamily)
LDTYHTFSFDTFHDPGPLGSGFRSLRVINEDRVRPGFGFGTHPHRDMEIITCVLEGALEHKDSMGNTSVIRPGEVQRMSAGTGVVHSEYNPSKQEMVHLLQIWILPAERGLQPSYEQKTFQPEESRNGFRLIASRDGREGSVLIHQDADVYLARLEPGKNVAHQLRTGRYAWVHIVRGSARINGAILHTGDGAAVSGEESLTFACEEHTEVLIFDLA